VLGLEQPEGPADAFIDAGCDECSELERRRPKKACDGLVEAASGVGCDVDRDEDMVPPK